MGLEARGHPNRPPFPWYWGSTGPTSKPVRTRFDAGAHRRPRRDMPMGKRGREAFDLVAEESGEASKRLVADLFSGY